MRETYMATDPISILLFNQKIFHGYNIKVTFKSSVWSNARRERQEGHGSAVLNGAGEEAVTTVVVIIYWDVNST